MKLGRKMKTLYNDFDEEITVCESCEELLNEGITDDREFFYNATLSSAHMCSVCGAYDL